MCGLLFKGIVLPVSQCYIASYHKTQSADDPCVRNNVIQRFSLMGVNLCLLTAYDIGLLYQEIIRMYPA